jgi:hypothetical protein
MPDVPNDAKVVTLEKPKILAKIKCTPPQSASKSVMPFVASCVKKHPILVMIVSWGKLRIMELRRG